MEGYWLDFGRPEQYLAATAAVLTGAVRTDVPFQQIGEGTDIAPDALVDAVTSLGMRVRIGAGARVERCILQDDVIVGANTVLERVIAEEGVSIGDDVRASGAVLPRGTVIGRGARL